MNIVFLDRDTLAPQTKLAELPFEHHLSVYPKTNESDIIERISNADILIVNKVTIRDHHLAHAPNLKLIAVAATGTDNIDLPACQQRGIVVSNIQNYAGQSVPEHTFGLIFSLRRQIHAYHQAIKSGRWQESGTFCFFDYPIKNLAGSCLGVIGGGTLGQAVITMAHALGMKTLLAEHKGVNPRNERYTSFNEVLRQADIISLHCPLTDQTKDLISHKEFDLMEQNPLIINTARGAIVNEHALVEALNNGKISGAGFDVVSNEPMAQNHVFMSLLDKPNFLLTPHIAWASNEAMQALADQLIDNIIQFVKGTPTRRVM